MDTRKTMTDQERQIAYGGESQEIRLTDIQRLIASGLHVDARDSYGNSMLMFAAQADAAEVVRYLLEQKADVHLVDKSGGTALTRATKNGFLATADLLLQSGATYRQLPKDIMYEMACLMEFAVDEKDVARQERILKASRVFLENGAPASDGALVHCARHSLYELAELLLRHGANPNASVAGMDVCTHAANQGDQQMVALIRKTAFNKS